MRRFAGAALVAFAFAFPASVAGQDLIPERRSVVWADTDLPGGDIASIFDTSHESCERACLGNNSCEAYTFNTRNGSCFLKAGPGGAESFAGAYSAFVLSAPEGAEALAATRRAEMRFVDDWDMRQAREMAAGLGRAHVTGPASVEEHLDAAHEAELRGDLARAVSHTGAALNRADRADLWDEYARRALGASRQYSGDRYWYQDRALYGALNGYLRARTSAERHNVLVTAAMVLEDRGRGRDMVQALRLAQSVEERWDTASLLADASEKYGFRVSGSRVEADLARPRICADFTEDLAASGVDFEDFLRLPAPGLAVESGGSRSLCVTGVEHGQSYSLTLRQGLPAADGQTLARDVELTLYVRDRNPGVRFPGRGYVLPRSENAALPVETVNTETLDLVLFRVTDRNLLRSIQSSYLTAPLHRYDEEYFSEEFAEKIWEGTAQVSQEVNRDVTTRLPMAEALAGQPAGIYALKASVPGVDPYENASGWQWFVVSDLGLTTFSGVDGLNVFVRSLATAGAKEGVTVELLSRANSVLGTAVTDASGHARFEAGLIRGTGSSAPGMVVVKEGEADIGFLSLTDPEFDLADRGVAGREAAPPVDVFLTTDRGAYRAGETIHATALARDSTASAIEGLPLTAVLTRPDGVEYSRQLVSDSGAGGHVFALPVAGTAPRGVWSLTILADAGAEPLARRTLLVEDFLPERIDFEIAIEGGVALGAAAFPVSLQADYLFGAPAAGLAVEGEVILRAAPGLADWPGYVFGRHDQPFRTVMEPLFASATDASGAARLDARLPEIEDPGRPLEAVVTLRVAEGSGRPVERRLETAVAPLSPMIGIRPAFDGVVREGTEARFHLIGLGPDLAPEAFDTRWELTRIRTDYQWYQNWGSWFWEPVTTRSRIAEGTARLGEGPVEIAASVEWGQYELRVTRADGTAAESSTTFWAGWYAPADVTSSPDTLELSLDKPAYAPGETARLRVVPRASGTALVTVLSNRLVAMQAVEVTEGENLIELEVTEDWGAGVYVTASVIRPMDAGAGRNPTRAMGLAHARIDPGARALSAVVEVAAESAPRAPLDIAVKVDGVAAGDTAFVTIAAVDQGILNLTGFTAPDPSDHYFGQRKLGVGIRDVYGRLIDGLNGAMGEVRSGGDAGAQARLQAPPPTEELVAWFSGPVEVGTDGYARASFDLPAFNGSVKVMAVAWSKTGVGQAEADVLVRDPVVVTASLPRFMAPGDESRLLLELVHATGPAGEIGLDAVSEGVSVGAAPGGIVLAEGGRAVIELPVVAREPGLHRVTVTLTTPDGRTLDKVLNLPVQLNDPEIAKISRFDLATGQSFTLDQAVFADMVPGTARSVLAAGPVARLNAPGLIAMLDRYPYGCTEQVASAAMPLLYFESVAQAMGLAGATDPRARLRDAVSAILANQGSEGGFGLWSSGSGDLWLDAYVTDFLSRARAQGYEVPDLAFRNALTNLRNQVNAAPGFDRGDSAGGNLAYALMVLAREGAAAIGDLRYYADVKSDDLGTPIALAQLGAALAFYGDQTRADAMFRKAAAMVDAMPDDAPEQIWRADYGTAYRDTAALLALAVEAGSTAIDREALTDRLARQAGRLSTQEASWALLAAHALVGRPDSAGLEFAGADPSGAPVRLLEEGAAPISVTNRGADTTVTVTTYGVPAEPEPAGGNGYAITRSYFTMEGTPVDDLRVTQGERLVVVLEVTPFGRSDGRLMVADPLPAGFEIDNPNLISGGSTAQLGWLNAESEVKHSEFRQDRFLTAIDWSSPNAFRLAYIVRAVSPGDFHHPAASVEDMYRPDFRARTEAGRVGVTAP
ncbi:alpha-2-macroglobulin family protein [Pseudogemmobacter sonorensis]|uniref:alpha-2-macroglobulin family protein n=1 Tax=Pseudogemmobacter sonorensis TaxID=2989681 RepID=UPI0036D020EB